MIWGEPNRADRFQPNSADGPQSARAYAPILDAAYGALKGVSRRNIVIGGMTWTGRRREAGAVHELHAAAATDGPPRLDWFGHNPFPFRFPNLRELAIGGRVSRHLRPRHLPAPAAADVRQARAVLAVRVPRALRPAVQDLSPGGVASGPGALAGRPPTALPTASTPWRAWAGSRCSTSPSQRGQLELGAADGRPASPSPRYAAYRRPGASGCRPLVRAQGASHAGARPGRVRVRVGAAAVGARAAAGTASDRPNQANGEARLAPDDRARGAPAAPRALRALRASASWCDGEAHRVDTVARSFPLNYLR